MASHLSPTDAPPRLPGPGFLDNLGRMVRLPGNPLGTFEGLRRDYGRLAYMRVGPYPLWLVGEPEAIHHVLVSNARNYVKSPTYRGLRLVLGNGLVTSDGDFWRRQRRLAQPAFHRQRLVGFADTMARCAGDMLADWDTRGSAFEVDLHAEMLALTLRTVGLTLLGADLAEIAPRAHDALEIALARAAEVAEVLVPTPTWLPTPANFRFRRALRFLDSVVLELIDERRREAEPRPDLLGMLMAATDETGTERMSDRQLRDEVMTLFIAGHETTANALTWAWMLLARHPAVLDRLAQEVDEVLGDRPATFEDVAKLVYTGQVVREAMRLYPPAWIVERQAVAADEIGGFPVRPGSLVAVCPYLVHRDPELWPDPEAFDPDRFAPEAERGRHRYAYLPFGAGPRTCIGNGFALMEATMFLAMTARRWRLSLVPGRPIQAEAGITLRPVGGLPMSARRRGSPTTG